MRLIRILLPVLFLLAGCETPARYAWKKAGVSNFDAQSAQSECRYQVRVNKVSAPEQSGVITDCMQGKGYRWVRTN